MGKNRQVPFPSMQVGKKLRNGGVWGEWETAYSSYRHLNSITHPHLHSLKDSQPNQQVNKTNARQRTGLLRSCSADTKKSDPNNWRDGYPASTGVSHGRCWQSRWGTTAPTKPNHFLIEKWGQHIALPSGLISMFFSEMSGNAPWTEGAPNFSGHTKGTGLQKNLLTI